MDKLKYVSTERYYEGIVVEINDCAVGIDFKGRMGKLYVPKRMVISDYELKIGQEVGFMMTYPEVLGPDVDEEYANNAIKQQQLRKVK
ncbi:hypothetical protein PV797_03780 [Clostridiaceae bacterium M8S5]|nr:hypothetical protein PV797_03780 [Clostridiaceae bacterium M8S5]